MESAGRSTRREVEPGASEYHGSPDSRHQMTYRYPKLRAYFEFTVALLMGAALYIGIQPMLWGWMLFAPLFLYLVFKAIGTYRYSLTLDGDRITVSDSERQYLVSEITAINVWDAKGARIAVITFADRSKLSFPSQLKGFDDLVALLRKQTNLPKPEREA